jgi:hypothetical protein
MICFPPTQVSVLHCTPALLLRISADDLRALLIGSSPPLRLVALVGATLQTPHSCEEAVILLLCKAIDMHTFCTPETTAMQFFGICFPFHASSFFYSIRQRH